MDVKSWMKILISVFLAFSCVLISVGYASVTDSLTIVGHANTKVVEGIYITEMVEHSTSNIDKNEYEFVATTTNVNNTISRGTDASAGVVEYKVTVFNNTENTYYYRDVYYETLLGDYNGNDYITDTPDDYSIGIECIFDSAEAKKILPGQKVVLSVVYTVGKEIGADIDLKFLINIRFGIHVAGEREAISAVEARFLKILNTQSTYEYLVDVLDNKFDGYSDWTSNYVGNVSGASNGAFSEDSMAVNSLFQNQLIMTIDGELREVTVIIKHENVDWDYGTGDDYTAVHPDGGTYSAQGCEMILYMTIDPLDVGGAYVPVYAMVFTCERDWSTGARRSDWYRCGGTFVGLAEVSDYDGTVGGTGSFRTTTWVSQPETYVLTDGYSCSVNNGFWTDEFYMESFSYTIDSYVNLHYALEAYNEEAPRVIQQLLDDARRLIANMNYAGEGIDYLRSVYEKYYWKYAYNNGIVDTNWPMNTSRIFHPVIENLYAVVKGVLDDMSDPS